MEYTWSSNLHYLQQRKRPFSKLRCIETAFERSPKDLIEKLFMFLNNFDKLN